MPISPSKSRDLANENNKILTYYIISNAQNISCRTFFLAAIILKIVAILKLLPIKQA
jgi:hypothetical protein